MDTSETYIRMNDSNEVQNLSSLLTLGEQQGSVFAKADDHNCIVWAANMIVVPPAIRFIRLFRQDQLQELVAYKNTRELLMRFADWVEHETNYRRESMEQLWLAFVMKERWNKLWNGKDWINQ